MPKEKDKATSGEDTEGKSTSDKKSRDNDDVSPSDSSSELEPVRSKKGEPADNLRRRSEWFQKRRGGA